MPDAYDRYRLLAQGRTQRKTQQRYAQTALPSAGGGVYASPAVLVPGASPAAAGANSMTLDVLESGNYGRTTQRTSGSPVQYALSETPPWPPPTTGHVAIEAHSPQPTLFTVGKSYSLGQVDHMYELIVGFLKFETSALPDTASVTGATLRLNMASPAIDDEGGRALALEWYSWTTPFTGADWTATVGTSAHPGVSLSTLPPGGSWVEVPLQNANVNVSKTAQTGLRLQVTGGAPGQLLVRSGAAGAHFRSGFGAAYLGEDPAALAALGPKLVVHYN